MTILSALAGAPLTVFNNVFIPGVLKEPADPPFNQTDPETLYGSL
jgi:hypothetical protein